MGALAQFVILLVQVFPSALKAIQAWQDYNGQKLNRERRARLASDIKTVVQAAVTSKDTSGLEDAIKNLGRPPVIAKPSDTQTVQNPS